MLHITGVQRGVEQHNPIAARDVAQAVIDRVELLATFSDLGRPGEVKRPGMSISEAERSDIRAQNVYVTDDSLAVDLVDGRTIIVPLAWLTETIPKQGEARDATVMYG